MDDSSGEDAEPEVVECGHRGVWTSNRLAATPHSIVSQRCNRRGRCGSGFSSYKQVCLCKLVFVSVLKLLPSSVAYSLVKHFFSSRPSKPSRLRFCASDDCSYKTGNKFPRFIPRSSRPLFEPQDPAPPQLCSERDFHHILATNHTGFIVAESAQADLFYVPYYTGCLSRDVPRREARSGTLMPEYVTALNALPERQRFGGANFFSYTQRQFT